MKKELLIRNDKRKSIELPEPYQPEYVRLNRLPHQEEIDQNELKQTIQTLSAVSRRGFTPIVPIVSEQQREMEQAYRIPKPIEAPLPPNLQPRVSAPLTAGNRAQQPMVQQPMVQQPMVQQPMVQQPMVQQPMVQQPQEVRQKSWTSTSDILVDDIPSPPMLRERGPWTTIDPFEVVESSPQEEDAPDGDAPIEVEACSLEDVRDGCYCLLIRNETFSVESLETALEVIKIILDSEDEQYKDIDLKDISLFKRLPIKFGFHVG